MIILQGYINDLLKGGEGSGDKEDHPFHGNQWTSGSGSSNVISMRYPKSNPPSKNFQSKINKAITNMPQKISDFINGKNIDVMACDDGGKSSEFYGHQNAVGLHTDAGIFIAERTGSGHKNSDPEGTLFHEIGHEMYYQAKGTGEFNRTFNDEIQKASSTEKYLMKHYLLNEREAFAETFSHVYSTSKHSGNIGRSRFEKLFPKSISMLKGMVEK